VFGWYAEIPPGAAVIEVEVGTLGDDGDCFTGVSGATGWLEAEELGD